MRSTTLLSFFVISALSPAVAAQPAEPSTEPPAEPVAEPPIGDTAPAAIETPPARPVVVYPPAEALRPLPPGAIWREDDDDSDMRYPGYFVAGLITLGGGVGFAIGGVAAAFAGDEKTALGLGTLATTAWGTGVPLTLLGATPDPAGDSATAYAGIALATTGALAFGLGGTVWATREGEEQENPDYIAPIVLMGAGGAGLVAGVITWAIGAARDEDSEARDRQERGAEIALEVGPTSLGLSGRF